MHTLSRLTLPVATAAVLVLIALALPVSGEVSNQYVNISPLPAGGVALDEMGKPDPRGAVHTNIPAAYTPGSGYFSVAAYQGDYSTKLSPYYSDPFGNGTGILSAGFFNKSRTYFSVMYLSRALDKALNLQCQLRDEDEKSPALAIGIQDIFRTERANRSPYLVATKRFDIKDVPCYGTLGFGWGRFDEKPFAGVSASFNRYVSGMLEFDGFGTNAGLAIRPLPATGISLVVARNDLSSWLLGASLTVNH